VLREMTEDFAIQKRIQQQERLAAVGHLASGIAHDFNNILTGIIGFADLLQRRESTPSQMKEPLNHIVKQAQRGAQLIEQILDFSRQSPAKKQPVEIVPFVHTIIRLLKRTIPENIHISLEIEDPNRNYSLNIDPTQIQQALTNLAINARDAMPQGGELTFKLFSLTIGPNDSKPAPELTAGEWFGLSVSDTGVGISADIQHLIFEPFFTTKEVGKGTGLGLSQVYGILKQHNGCIVVDSAKNTGTTVTLYFPVTVQHKISVPPQQSVEDFRSGQGETILLVEDESAVLEVAQVMLEHLGYSVLPARDGYEALAIYDRNEKEISLVLTDMTMPRLGGLLLAQTLKARNPAVKIIALSGYPLTQDDKALLSQGIVDWLQKPLTLDKLNKTISQTLGKNNHLA